VLNGPIQEAVELVLVQVQRIHLEEGEQVEVDFHPHCHHLKKKPEQKKAQTSNTAHRSKKAQLLNEARRPKKAQMSN
jgi:hypothetical protein